MPRIARKNITGEKIYHIMIQGINKENIFIKEQQKNKYIDLMKKYKNEYEINLITFCIMNNHAHLLIKVNKIENLTKYMHKLNTLYAIYYNKNEERVGYVYRDRYKIQIIKDRKHMYNCIIYIHNNPVKAKICKNIQQYKFSGYKDFFTENNRTLNEIFENKNQYIKAHNANNINMNFLEDEEERKLEIKSEINNYLNEKKINILELKFNNQLLIPIIFKLKEIYNLSNEKIGKELNISKEKIRKILINVDKKGVPFDNELPK